jgi:hypothetical protein
VYAPAGTSSSIDSSSGSPVTVLDSGPTMSNVASTKRYWLPLGAAPVSLMEMVPRAASPSVGPWQAVADPRSSTTSASLSNSNTFVIDIRTLAHMDHSLSP